MSRVILQDRISSLGYYTGRGEILSNPVAKKSLLFILHTNLPYLHNKRKTAILTMWIMKTLKGKIRIFKRSSA